MAGVVNLMAPDVVLMGGGLVEAMPKIFLDEVGTGIEETAMTAYHGTYRLAVAKLGDDAGVIGLRSLGPRVRVVTRRRRR